MSNGKSSIIKQFSNLTNGILYNLKHNKLHLYTKALTELSLLLTALCGRRSWLLLLLFNPSDETGDKIIKLDKYRTFPVFLYSVHTKSRGFCIGFPFDIPKDIEQAVIEAHQLVKSVQTNPVGHKNLICRFEWAYKSFSVAKATCSLFTLSPSSKTATDFYITFILVLTDWDNYYSKCLLHCICRGKYPLCQEAWRQTRGKSNWL